MGKFPASWHAQLSLWTVKIGQLFFGSVRSTISSIGIALTVASSFEPLLLISRLASLLLDHWQSLLQSFWGTLLAFLPMQISASLAEFLTLIVLFVTLGVSSTGEAVKDTPGNRLMVWPVLATVFNLTIGFAYGVSTVFTSRIEGNGAQEFWGIMALLGVYLFALAISQQIKLAKKLLGALLLVVLIVVLDRASFILEWIVALARA